MSSRHTKRARELSDEDRASLIFGGILALVGFGVGLYYFSTPSGRKKMEEIRSRVIEARDDVLSRFEDLDEDEYEEILLEAFKLYRRLKEAETEEDFEKIALDLKSEFRNIKKNINVGKKERGTKQVSRKKTDRRVKRKKAPKNNTNKKKLPKKRLRNNIMDHPLIILRFFNSI